MSWSDAQVSNSTVWLAGLPEGAMAWVKTCHAAMSDDWPQGSGSLTASAGAAHANRIAARPARRRNIFLGCNFVIRIGGSLIPKTQGGRRLFPVLFAVEIRLPLFDESV